MDIKKLYYSIGEVSKLTRLKQYVLRYWETEFKQLKPQKNRSGNRTYRQSDIDTILTIKSLLYDKKFTIVGARKQLNSVVEDMGNGEEGSASSGISEKQKTVLGEIKEELQKILDIVFVVLTNQWYLYMECRQVKREHRFSPRSFDSTLWTNPLSHSRTIQMQFGLWCHLLDGF